MLVGEHAGKLVFEKYANFDRANEPVNVAIPFAKGIVPKDALGRFRVFGEKGDAASQVLALGHWDDGSVKWAKVDFMADLPANAGAVYGYDFEGPARKPALSPITILQTDDTLEIDNGCITLLLNNKAGSNLFSCLSRKNFRLGAQDMDGPYIIDENGIKHAALTGEAWTVEEHGAVLAKVSVPGTHRNVAGSGYMDFIVTIFVYANTPWFEVRYRIINRMAGEYTYIKQIAWDLYFENKLNSEYSIATSNYSSNIRTNKSDSTGLSYMIDGDHIINEANEHTPEVFHGTFFADWNAGEKGGICATLYQAYQNFPKALFANGEKLSMEILPAEYGGLKYYRGMAKSHRLFLHLHEGSEPIENINKRSLMLQSMDKPILPQSVYSQSGCLPDIFPKEKSQRLENRLVAMADNRGKAYGMLHWGDFPDSGYTRQGRGGGNHVWTNNEYDFPFAVMQLYARNGYRRMLDYMLTAAEHWVDIDICHFDPDPLKHGSQIEHSKDHVTGNVEISHEWVEGLMQYYYQTGDKFALNSAIGIGENIMRHLDEPRYRMETGINARETGWALRALTALYIETGNEYWLKHAEFIVSHFKNWKKTYGAWLAPYTDHAVVMVPFMIAIAVGSLMRYHRVKPSAETKTMIVDAVDDLIANCILDNGLFYYKELPSLRRPTANTIVLEALASAYELTGDKKYLLAGVPTFKANMGGTGSAGNKKEKIPDGVLVSGSSPKGFAQAFYPLAFYHYHATNAGLSGELETGVE